MNLKNLITKTRTYRRFDEKQAIDLETLESFVELARLSSSGANRQPLKYILINKPEDCDKVFPFLSWAGYLEDWPGPAKGERPSAYIIVLGDKSITDMFGVDHGIAAHAVMMGAVEKDFGGCIIASIKREEMMATLKIPDQYEVLLVLALGKPVEHVVIEDVLNNDIKYWRDANKIHHVPKRSLRDLIIKL